MSSEHLLSLGSLQKWLALPVDFCFSIVIKTANAGALYKTPTSTCILVHRQDSTIAFPFKDT